MITFTTVCYYWYDRWRRKLSYSITVLTMTFFLSAFLFTTPTQAQSLNLDQGANGAYTDPLSVRNPVKWQNGNLNQQQSHLIEGHSVPYRLVVSNLTAGQTYTITLGYDVVNSGKYALDFITGYDNLEPHTFTAPGGHTEAEDIFPFGDGTAYVAPTDEMAITLPAYLANNTANNAVAPPGAITKINDYWASLPESAKKMSIWGGTFDDAFGIQYAFFENSASISPAQVLELSRGETKAEFTIRFTANASEVTIAWGGHIANRLQWSYNNLGQPNSAGGLSGSPYHMRTITGGSQDRSLKVALAGPICPTELPVNAFSLCANSSFVNLPLGQCPDDVCVNTPLYFNIPVQSGALTYAWTVTKDGNPTVLASGSGAQFTFTPASGGEYTVNVVLGNESGFQATCTQNITVITVLANPASSTLCETVAGGGTAQFNLTALESTVIGSQTGVTVSWFTDAALTNAIATPATYTSGSGPVYAKVNKGICYASSVVTLTVKPRPVATHPGNQGMCNGESSQGLSFGSNVQGSTFAWSSSTDIGFGLSGTGSIPSFTATNNSTVSITTTVSVIATANDCEGPAQTFTITVNPTPTVNPVGNQTLCTGLLTEAVSFSGAADGTVYSWSISGSIGQSGSTGTGTLPSFTAANNGTEPVTATITVTPSYSNAGATCQGQPITFNITVNPAPVVDAVDDRTHCNGATGAAINFGANMASSSFTWTSTANVGFGMNGTTNIGSYTAINNTNAPVTATISVRATAGGCEGAVRTFTVTVLPTPVVNQPSNQTVCNGNKTAAITFSGTATSYTWTNNTPGIGLATSGSGPIEAFSAVNNENTPVTATITVTPVYVSGNVTCSGDAKSFTITVNPSPIVTAVDNRVHCNGATGAAINFGANITGSSFTWSSTVDVGFGMNGTTNIGSYTATNNTSAPVTATVSVWATASDCPGPVRTFTVTVNPTPTVNAIDNISLCPGDAGAAIQFGSNVTGATFKWTASANVGFGSEGTGNIAAFTATNNTGSPIIVTVSVIATANGCEGPARTFTVTVNPKPVLVITNPPQTCIPNTVDLTAPAVTAGSSLFGGTLSYWLDADATMPLTNPSAVAVGGTYYIKAVSGAGCVDIKPVVVTITQCTYCTYTQGAYGNAGGKACIGEPGTKLSTEALIKHSLNAWGGTMRIGTSAKYIDIRTSEWESVIKYLPGGGSSYSFKAKHVNGYISDPAVNFQGQYTKKAGKDYHIDNTLLAQTITLGLNMGIRGELDDLVLQGNKYLVTVNPQNGCGTTIAKTCTYDPVTGALINDPHTYKWIDGAVVDAIVGPKTVGGLFTLANRALAGENVGVSLSQIAGVVDAINNVFDECKLLVGYSATNSACQQAPATNTVPSSVTTEPTVDKLQVHATPNPYNDKVRFTIASPVSGQGSLEVYNLIGQKLATVYQGYLMAGRGQTVEYTVPQPNRTTLIFVLKVGGQQVTGKLLNRK